MIGRLILPLTFFLSKKVNKMDLKIERVGLFGWFLNVLINN